MKSPNTITTLPNDDTPTPLKRLGWSSFFREQLHNKNSELTPARIVGVRKNVYLANNGDKEILTTLAGRLFHKPEISLPAIGDWVLLKNSVIASILQRKNALARRASGGRNRKDNETHTDDQVIAVNLDKAFIVCGLDRDFNLRRIERYLTLVYNCGINPVIVLTKSDLHQNPNHIVQDVEAVAFGVPVYAVSAYDNTTISELSNLISQGQTVALLGSSGAGKSTLINRLHGEEIQSTSEVGSRVGKGRHTTTTRDLIVLPSGGMVIDNPGIREIGLGVGSSKTESAFPEIDELSQLCRFQDCSHTHEPGCHVVNAVSTGRITSARLESYQKIMRELNYFSNRDTKSAARIEKEQWKWISQKIKNIKKSRKQ